jgi:DNA end-binding protein Ku
MARALWSGTISFGLLNVPVKLYSAVARREIRLNELRGSDSARIRHKRVAEGSDEEVPYEEIVKGFEVSPGHFVPLTREELAELDPKKTRAIEIEDFVDLAEIDPIYFDRPYYLAPAEGAEKAYVLLVRAMSESRKVAIARFVMRNKEHLAAIRPMDGVLTIATMRFADEVVQPEELDDVLPAETPRIGKRELEMAQQLIESLATGFDPSRYEDTYRQELLEMIERKAEGQEVVAPVSEEPKPTEAPDLMAALEESIAAVKGHEAAHDGKGRRKAPAKGKAKATKSSGSGSKSRAKRGSRSGAKARS